MKIERKNILFILIIIVLWISLMFILETTKEQLTDYCGQEVLGAYRDKDSGYYLLYFLNKEQNGYNTIEVTEEEFNFNPEGTIVDCKYWK